MTSEPPPGLKGRSAAKPALLPKPKPRAMREHFVVPSIRGGEVALIQRSGVRRCEDAIKALDFGNSLLGVHAVSISNMSVAIVNGAASSISTVARWLTQKFRRGELGKIIGRS